jgi:hypothetical protein
MFNPTCVVLENIIEEGSTYSQRGYANVAYTIITSFKYVFILHLMREIIGTTDCFCQHLQQKSQDILSAMHLVSNTKTLLQKMRNEDWDSLLEEVIPFCNKHEIEIPNLVLVMLKFEVVVNGIILQWSIIIILTYLMLL